MAVRVEKSGTGKFLIRVQSHRAREKLISLLGYLPKGYYSWTRSGEWREVSPAELAKIQDAGIKGITKSLWTEDLRPYIKW